MTANEIATKYRSRETANQKLGPSHTILSLRNHPARLRLDPTNTKIEITEEDRRLLGNSLTEEIHSHHYDVARWLLFRRAMAYFESTLANTTASMPEDAAASAEIAAVRTLSDHLNDPENLDRWYGDQMKDFTEFLKDALVYALAAAKQNETVSENLEQNGTPKPPDKSTTNTITQETTEDQEPMLPLPHHRTH